MQEPITVEQAQQLYWKAIRFSRRVGDAWTMERHERYEVCLRLWSAIERLHWASAPHGTDIEERSAAYAQVLECLQVVRNLRYPKYSGMVAE